MYIYIEYEFMWAYVALQVSSVCVCSNVHLAYVYDRPVMNMHAYRYIHTYVHT